MNLLLTDFINRAISIDQLKFPYQIAQVECNFLIVGFQFVGF